ncbi:NADH-quinone oxidoreductase subunit A [Candidatus Pyrohabitans sp.]
MGEQYITIGLFVIIGLIFPVVTIFVASLLRKPRKPEPQKYLTYECSVLPFGPAWVQHNVEYYMYALLFVIFDVEVVFLYPWAVTYQSFGLFATLEVIIFIGVLTLGLAYAWNKGALEWMRGWR